MRKMISVDDIEEPVKRFLNGLEVSNDASVIDFNGRRVYIVVRPPTPINPNDDWNDELAQRRHTLIDKDIDARITPQESVELAELEEQFDRYRNRVAPLPIEHARDLLNRIQQLQQTP